MSDAKKNLTELCRAHELGPDLIEQSGDPGHLLDGVLESCEQLVAAKNPEADKGLSRLRSLILVAREARTLEERSATEAELKQLERQLERMGAELREAEARSAAMETRIHEILEQLEADGLLALDSEGVDAVDQVQAALLADLLDQTHGVVKVPCDLQGAAAVGHRLGQLSEGYLAVRDEDRRVQPRAGGVRRRGR